MTAIHVITEAEVRQHRPALCAWAEANGLDPNRMDAHGLTIEQVDGRTVIAYSEIQHGTDGRPLVDPSRRSSHLTVHRTRTLRHALPEGIGRPLCTCTLGRLDPDCRDHPGSTDVTLSDTGP